MRGSISVRKFRQAIAALPSDRPGVVPGIWYTTQKEHWLGWLAQYHGSGAYGRRPQAGHDARYAYNHIVNPQMLLWLSRACGVPRAVVQAAALEAAQKSTLMAQAAAIRRQVPWSEIEARLWSSAR